MPFFLLPLVQLCIQSRGRADSRLDCRRPLIPKPSVVRVPSFCIGAFSCRLHTQPFSCLLFRSAGLHSLARSAADGLLPFVSFFRVSRRPNREGACRVIDAPNTVLAFFVHSFVKPAFSLLSRLLRLCRGWEEDRRNTRGRHGHICTFPDIKPLPSRLRVVMCLVSHGRCVRRLPVRAAQLKKLAFQKKQNDFATFRFNFFVSIWRGGGKLLGRLSSIGHRSNRVGVPSFPQIISKSMTSTNSRVCVCVRVRACVNVFACLFICARKSNKKNKEKI